MLLIGWSLVEGIGAALVMPAIVSLVAATYSGKQRALAFGIIGGVAGAAIAAGPLIGGWVTTELSWRYVFAGETVIVIAILLVRRRLPRTPRAERRPQLDVVGVALSSLGLGLAVFGILKSSSWGWIEPLGALTIGGEEITPLGFSAVPFFILAGLGCLGAFAHVGGAARAPGPRHAARPRAAEDRDRCGPGLTTLMMQQLILLGTFFVLPVYLQVVLGLDAFETGKRLFPMSVTMFIAALAGPRLAAGLAPKRVCQAGLLALVVASIVLLGTIDVELDGTTFALALALFGVGAGLLLSQLGNVIMSSVDPAKINEAGGLQGTAQNLGASLGTALIGSVLIAALTTGFVERVEQNPAIPPEVREQVAEVAQKGIPVAPVADVEQAALDQGVPADRGARRSPPTTAMPSSTASSARSAPSPSSPCSRCGSRGTCRGGRRRRSGAQLLQAGRVERLDVALRLVHALRDRRGVERAPDRGEVAPRARADGLGLAPSPRRRARWPPRPRPRRCRPGRRRPPRPARRPRSPACVSSCVAAASLWAWPSWSPSSLKACCASSAKPLAASWTSIRDALLLLELLLLGGDLRVLVVDVGPERQRPRADADHRDEQHDGRDDPLRRRVARGFSVAGSLVMAPIVQCSAPPRQWGAPVRGSRARTRPRSGRTPSTAGRAMGASGSGEPMRGR